MKRRILSIITALALCLSLLPAVGIPALAAEDSGDAPSARATTGASTKDAFGITMVDETEENLANNPYGTDNWFTIFKVSELTVANCDNGGGWIQTYDFNPDGKVGSIGNIFGSGANEEPANSKEYNYAVMDMAPCDPTGCGQQDHTAVLAYEKDYNRVVFYLLDKNGNRVGNPVYIGRDETTYFMEQTRGYGSNGFLAVTSGDFDGDGKETLVIYVPLMRAKGDGTIDDPKDPILREYELVNGQLRLKRNVVDNVWDMLGIKDISATAGDNHGKTRQNAPVMQLLAEDTDKDGVDELIVTASLNDCSTNDVPKSERYSRLYVYDLHGNGWQQTYYQGFNNHSSTEIRAAKYIRWATSGVGNIDMSSPSGVDYPEIVTAGWVSESDYDKTHGIGSYVTSCTQTTRGADGTATGTYNTNQVVKTITGGGSEFTRGGHYCDDAVPGLFQVEVFNGNGTNNPATVLLSDTVYTYSTTGWEYAYRDDYFNDDDDGIGSAVITNGVILDTVSGNFDGNTAGREQVVFASLQKQSGSDHYFIRLYTYQTDEAGGWSCAKSVYLSNKAEWGILSLSAPDIDQDSTIARIKNISKTYTEPSVLAILEAAPYFSELGEQGGETGYGKTTGSGTGSTSSNGLKATVKTGFEWEVDDVLAGFGCGVSFEASVENSFSWETETSTSVEYSLEYANDTGENQVIVYRRPVWAYEYEIKDHPDGSMVQIKEGTLATNMISVDEYNELAEYYNLDPIADGVLAEGGNPFSYRSTINGLSKAVIAPDTANYKGSGSVSQSLANSTETQNSFTYELECSVEVGGTAFGVTLAVGAGYTHSEGAYTVNSSEISKSGSVACSDVPGYDFQWQFAHWTVPLNKVEVPVLGYVLTNVTAPPSPPVNLSAEDVTATSATICWEHGGRSADAYYIYQYFPDTNTYIQISEVDGTEDSYTITNLMPNTTYHYVISSYTAPGTSSTNEAATSVYSEDLGLTTHPENAQPVTVSELEDATAKPGGEAVFQITATPPATTDYTTVNYQWQKRSASGTWEDVDGATSSSLTISGVAKDMDGSLYRCCVTALFRGTPITYYSNSAELKVGRDQAAATLTVTNAAGGSGTLPEPYTGKADYQAQTGTTTTEVTTREPVTIVDGGITYTVYSIDADGTLSYYAATGSGVDAVYYQATKTGDSYALGSRLTLSTVLTYQGIDGGDYSPPAGFDPDGSVTTTTSEGNTTKTYTLTALVTGTERDEADTRIASVTNVAYYWLLRGDNGNEYYTYGTDGAVGEAAAEDVIPDPNELYNVISKSADSAILGRDESCEEESGYWYFILSTENAVTPFQAVSTDTYSANGTPDTTFNPTQLSVVTRETTQTVSTPVYSPASGDTLTLSSTVTAGGRAVSGVTVDFQITNQQTRATTTVSAVTNANGTATGAWRAPASGLYSIQAVAQPTNDTTSAASGLKYYDAQASTPKEYRIVFQNGSAVTSSVRFGTSVSFGLQSRERNNNGTWGSWTAASETVTYIVTAPNAAAADANSPYTPASAGYHRFQAVNENGIQLAAATLEVTRVPVTITPTWTGAVPQNVGAVTLTATGANLSDAYLKTVFDINCPYFSNTAASGRFTVSLSYKTDSDSAAIVNAFKNNYIVTLKSDTFLIQPNSAQVTFSSGENGNILGRYGDNLYTMPESSSRINGQKLVFQATPDAGFLVDQWIINGTAYAAGTNLPSGMELSNDRQTLTIPYFDVDAHTGGSGNAKALTVQVTFRNDNYTITYGVNGSGGTLSAAVSKDGSAENPLGTGGSVMLGSTVTFTAVPETDYAIEKWTVDGQTYTREDGTTLYRGTTLTLDNVTESHTVQVSFTKQMAPLNVTANVVDETGTVNTSLGSIITTDPDNGDNPIALSGLKAGQSITFTVQVANTSNNAVKEWQAKKAGETSFTTIKGSGGQTSISLYNLEEDIEVRVIVATAQRYTLDWEIGGEYPSGTTLTASSNGASLTSGEAQNAFISVDFTLTLDDAYYVESWSGAVQDSADPKKAALGSLTGDTTVTVTVKKKPVVTIGTAAGGSVTVTGTVNGERKTITSGGYVDYGTNLTVTLSPAKGYRVGTISGQNPAYTDTGATGATTDEMAYTIRNIRVNQTVTPVFVPLSVYRISYSVVDTNGAEAGGVNGTLAADVSRKGMSIYETEHDKTAAASGSTQVYEGGRIILTAVPNDGYRVKGWTIGGKVYQVNGSDFVGQSLTLDGEMLSRLFDENGAIPEITVQFENGDPRITFSSPEHGTLTAEAAGAPFASGGSTAVEVSFTVVPDDHYEVRAWTVNDEIVEGAVGTTFTLTPGTVNADVAVILQGELLALTIEAGRGGTVSGVPEVIRYGDIIALTAEPGAGFTFEGWYLDGEALSSEETYTFTAQTGGRYQAVFAPTADNVVTFSLNDSAMGTITAAAGGISFPSGTSLEGGQELVFTVAPNGGFRVKEWSGLPEDAVISADQTIATVSALNGNLTVTAVLEAIPVYTITLAESANGSITAQVNGQDVTQVQEGTVVTFQARANPYWMFSNWTDAAAGQTGNPFTMEVNQDITVGAAFKAAVRYSVQFSVDGGTGGSISGTADGIAMTSGAQHVGNSALVFTAAPASGKMVSKWTINGQTVDGNLSNTLAIQLTGNTTVTAAFEDYVGYEIPTSQKTYRIEAVERAPSDTSPETDIRKNGTVTFTVKPNVADGDAMWSKLEINGYDCIAGEGTVTGCDSVTAVENGDGSYTVTITNVTGDITADIEAQTVVIDGLDGYKPPQTLIDEGITSVDDIITRLVIELTGAAETQAFYDIALKYLDAEGKWMDVTPENFPEGGVDVQLPYPEGSTQQDMFTVVHMLTAPGKAGTVEKVEYTKNSDGLSFHVDSLSPFGVSWVSDYTVSFDSQGGSAVGSQKVQPGGNVAKPGEPTRSGYRFDGWYQDSACTEKWDFDTDTVTENITLYAKWTKVYTVSFNSQGGSAVDSQTVAEGEQAAKPGNPTQSGYRFDGWYQDSACTTEWDFATDTVIENITLYAKWTKVYTVSFNSQGGSAVSSQTVTAGEKAARPSDPTRSGYTFGGWYQDSACTVEWHFDTDAVTKDITLCAKWTKVDTGSTGGPGSSGGPGGSNQGGLEPAAKVYTVSFDSQGGSTVSSQTVTAGEKAVKPSDPTRSGYTFDGWYQDSACTTKWDFDTGAVTENVTLYAKWTAAPCDGGEDCPSHGFTDLGPVGTWYHEAVDYVLRNGLMDGYGNGTFGPSDNLTRAQFAQVFYNKEGRPPVTSGSAFTDVADRQWYAPAITWATANDIVRGYGNNQFGPNDNITREQMAVMLWRYAGSPAPTDKELHFKDADRISEYALEAMQWAVENGIFQGLGNGLLDPRGLATRAQVAQMLKNYYMNMEE